MCANRAARLLHRAECVFSSRMWTRTRISEVGSRNAAEFRQQNHAARRLLHRTGSPVILAVPTDPILLPPETRLWRVFLFWGWFSTSWNFLRIAWRARPESVWPRLSLPEYPSHGKQNTTLHCSDKTSTTD